MEAGDPAVDGALDEFLKRPAIAETSSVPDDNEMMVEAPDAQAGSESIVLKILLPEKETGHVIGKGGSVLNKIKEASGTRVRISAMDEVIPMTRERICTIVGTLPAVLLAQKLISTALVENVKPLIDEPVFNQRTLKLLLSHAAVGCIIGRGGSLIKELMLQTGAVIKASQPSELIQATNERWMSITGTAEAVEASVGAVMSQIANSPSTQQLKELDYSCLKHAAAAAVAATAAYGGMPWPPHHHPHHPHHPHHRHHPHHPYHPHQHPGAARPMMPPGCGGGYTMAAPPMQLPPPPRPGAANAPMPYKQFMHLLEDHVSPEASQQKYQEYLRAFGAAAAASTAASAASGGGAGPEVSETLSLPDKMVSGLIGKGGLVIKDLMARSGAQIQVSQKGETQGGERVVTMTGVPNAVAMAQHFIKERLKEIEAHNAARENGQAQGRPHPGQPSMAPPQGYGGQPYGQPPYMQQGYTPTQPSPFVQHGLQPGMPLSMPQSSMNTMFSGQPSFQQQWQ